MKGRELRVVFALSLSWAAWFYVLWAFDRAAMAWLERPFSPVLDWLSIPVALSLGAGVTAILGYRRPSFLRVPESVSRTRLAVRFVACALPVGLILAVSFAAAAGAAEWLTGDPEDTWYGVSVFFAAMWYPLLLTPAITCLVVWWTARSRGEDS